MKFISNLWSSFFLVYLFEMDKKRNKKQNTLRSAKCCIRLTWRHSKDSQTRWLVWVFLLRSSSSFNHFSFHSLNFYFFSVRIFFFIFFAFLLAFRWKEEYIHTSWLRGFAASWIFSFAKSSMNFEPYCDLRKMKSKVHSFSIFSLRQRSNSVRSKSDPRIYCTKNKSPIMTLFSSPLRLSSKSPDCWKFKKVFKTWRREESRSVVFSISLSTRNWKIHSYMWNSRSLKCLFWLLRDEQKKRELLSYKQTNEDLC